MKKIYSIFLIIMSMALFGQKIYYVKKGGTGDGSSWDKAFGELPTTVFGGTAVDRPIDDVKIYIAEGDYDFSNTYTYIGNEVVLQGGFSKDATGTDLSSYNPDIYASRIVKRAKDRFLVIDSRTGTYEENRITVKGLYFLSTGSAGTTWGNIINQTGTIAKYVQLKVEDCVIHDSQSSSGMIRLASSTRGKVSHWIHNNKFYRNTMGATGPFEYTTVHGDAKIVISNNLFAENTATDGAGFYATTAGNFSGDESRYYIIGNVFSCGSTLHGAAIYLTTSGNTLIKGNVFLGNKARLYGGAIFATAVGGLHIEDNFFIQNSTTDTSGIGGGGAISVEGTISTGSIMTTNYIKNNVFYENTVETSNVTYGGSAISFALNNPSDDAKYDITGNVFAYNKLNYKDQGTIDLRGSAVGRLDGNTFYGNANGDGELHFNTELKVRSLTNIAEITNNTFQLAKEEDYTGNPIGPNIITGGNSFGSTAADIMNLQPGEFEIDCYSGGFSCEKVNDIISEGAVAIPSQVGISAFQSQPDSWPAKDQDTNPINNGALVLESNELPFVVTRMDNPEKILGKGPEMKGALVYDTNRQCMMLFDGEKWGCLSKSCDISVEDILKGIKNKMKP